MPLPRTPPLCLALILLSLTAHAAKLPEWLALKGSVELRESVIAGAPSTNWLTGTQLQNRLDLSVYPIDILTLQLGIRNRLLLGEQYELFRPLGIAHAFNADPGMVDLQFNWWDGYSAILNTSIDRLFVDLTAGEWQVRIGRHRINWGKNLVWNPNDLFNAYSLFDVSYPEGPGVDAVLMRRYLGAMSQIEMVAAGANDLDSAGVAALGQVNAFGFDIQMLGGWVRRAAVVGAGFSGQLGGAALRGEISVFSDDSFDRDPQTVWSLSSDYTLPFELYLHGSVLYNSEGKHSFDHEPAIPSFDSRLSARSLSPARWQLFAQLAYPVTPLLRLDCSVIVNPDDYSAAIMPLANYSLATNVEASLQAQLQIGEEGEQYRGDEHVVYVSVRWSF